MESDMELAEMDNLNYDWLDKAGWKSAFQQTHTLNVTGGSERATYYAGATYFDQGANLGDQSYKRYRNVHKQNLSAPWND